MRASFPRAHITGWQLALLGNGSFGVPQRLCSCSNVVFVLYYCLGAGVCTLLTAPLVPPIVGEDVTFAPWALGSAFLQFVAIHLCFVAFDLIGIALCCGLGELLPSCGEIDRPAMTFPVHYAEAVLRIC